MSASWLTKEGVFEALDRTLQDICESIKMMGGITVLLAGDFIHTLPVVPWGTRAYEVKTSFKSSCLWPKCPSSFFNSQHEGSDEV